ncbi:MAG: sorbosone dehydrogenase family protein, partial [Candidatus Nanohaloarchaea archaeon]
NGTVPPSNPRDTFAFTIGHRNPQGLAVDPETGSIFATEHGGWRHDEVNRLQAGQNYGWPYYTCNRTKMGDAPPINHTGPVWCAEEWTIAPSDAAFMDAPGHPWHGDLFVPGLRSNHVRRFIIENGSVVHEEVFYIPAGEHISQRLRTLVPHEGEIWVLGSRKGIIRLSPPGTP